MQLGLEILEGLDHTLTVFELVEIGGDVVGAALA